MVRRLPPWLLASLLLLPAAQAVGQVNPGPSLSFEEGAVTASGLTAGGKAVWFGAERRIDEEFSTELVRHQGLEPVAADGTARLVLDRPAARTSVWVVVDLARSKSSQGANRFAAAGGPSVLSEGHSSRWRTQCLRNS